MAHDILETVSAAAGEGFLLRLGKNDGKHVLRVGNIEIQSKLFDTPFGTGYLGQHLGMQIPVVVRVMHTDVRARLKDFDRFLRETRTMARLRHPNVACLIDMGEVDGYVFSVFEYVEGVPLAERIKSSSMTETQAVSLLLPVAEGLVEMWRKGGVHRGVSPHTIYIQADGTPKLEMTILRRSYTEPQFKEFLTPQMAPYWSPEEIRNQRLDASSDMWSFGATLYHAVTGRTPFVANTDKGMLSSVLCDEPAEPRKINPHVSTAMSTLLMKLLSRDLEDRFASGSEFLGAIYNLECRISMMAERDNSVMFSELTPPPAGWKKTELKIGEIVGNCRLEKKLGAGGFGVVFLARHRVLDIYVAVKVLPAESAQRDPTFVDMFLREARTAARLRHANVISIFEAGELDGHHYLIMEYAPGGTVAELMILQGGLLPPKRVVRIMLETARGLAAAENLSIVHRDIKPENLMLGHDDEVKIADLGLAKRLLPPETEHTIRKSIFKDQLTMHGEPGMMAGTPAYMAPETAVDPARVDGRADLYALGVTAFHMLTGKLPFEGTSIMEVVMKHVTQEPVSVREHNLDVPVELADMVLKLMQKKPEHRYQHASELVQVLEKMQLE